MRPVGFFLFFILLSVYAKASDSMTKVPVRNKGRFFIEGGNSFNRVRLYSLSGTATPDYQLKGQYAFSFGIGYSRYYKKVVAAISLRRVGLGDQITVKRFPAPAQVPGVFIGGYKNNFLLGVSGGYHFQVKKLILDPVLGVAISLNPPLNSQTSAYVTGGNDTVHLVRTMPYIKHLVFCHGRTHGGLSCKNWSVRFFCWPLQ